MIRQLHLGDFTVDVLFKEIKNIHLSVYPPQGKVRVSAPLRMKMDLIRIFVISKLAWIKRQQKKFRDQERETLREYLDRESHYVWGKRHLLVVCQGDKAPFIELKHNKMLLSVRPGTDRKKRDAVVQEWYRLQLKQAASSLVSKWEPLLGVKVGKFFVRHMKTKWGSNNPIRRNIRLNTDLAMKPRECLEYIMVHEMVHLLEPTHNARFISLMDRFMPRWQFYRNQLNRLSVCHEDWVY